MTSLYSINYHTRAHKRDAFIEFIKSLLLTPFVLHTRPASTRLAGLGLEEDVDVPVTPNDTENGRTNVDRYSEILECIEELIVDHMLHQQGKLPELSRLSTLVPSIGRFFTPLPLKDSFMRQDSKRSISARRFVPPSFNDVRAILNDAQVMAIAPTIKMITFDGDMTLYADGADFAKDSKLVRLLVDLLRHGLYVAIVTAAGYPGDAKRYEQRLWGLLDGFKDSGLSKEALGRFYVLGGECNYLFRYDVESNHLVYMQPETYQTESVQAWSKDSARITELLNLAQSTVEECARETGLSDKVTILRKDRAIGVVHNDDATLTREQLDEFALAAQRRLNNQQHANLIRSGQPPLPFCAFNGGSDVWVDIGNKLIGVQMLQQILGAEGNETLHVGDQFLSTGNDIATRTACCTAWITSPEETAEVLTDLCAQLDQRRPLNGLKRKEPTQ
ncbi:IMP 5'-nucleotidase [Gaertneriomyces sp. JEL0708]|nr:IMP 5'-nucleotidase [Gaertneriomyces sp. JEL0708]